MAQESGGLGRSSREAAGSSPDREPCVARRAARRRRTAHESCHGSARLSRSTTSAAPKPPRRLPAPRPKTRARSAWAPGASPAAGMEPTVPADRASPLRLSVSACWRLCALALPAGQSRQPAGPRPSPPLPRLGLTPRHSDAKRRDHHGALTFLLGALALSGLQPVPAGAPAGSGGWRLARLAPPTPVVARPGGAAQATGREPP